MLSIIRHSITTRILFGFLGLYFLNISVDPSDVTSHHLPEDLSFNDQESLVEVLVEKVLGFENAIEEYDDNDTEEHNQQKNSKIDLAFWEFSNENPSIVIATSLHANFPNKLDDLSTGHLDHDTPPPKIRYQS